LAAVFPSIVPWNNICTKNLVWKIKKKERSAGNGDLRSSETSGWWGLRRHVSRIE